ncbi:MAG TPA: PEP-CTERM sorting domain-containing protein [Candidatus Acidoferrales bacterium]|nr:PEP-CTERM sorting domain-containing protein [Candidatus Acidoferrales bacterium]
MLRRISIVFSVFAVFALLSAGGAKADELFTFTISGNTYSWQLPSTLTIQPPNMSVDGLFFELESVPLVENGVAQSTPGILDFFSSADGGGFELSDSVLLNEFGQNNQQLYTGAESSPTFIPGTYTLFDADINNNLTGLTGTLVINSVATPEPGSLLLIGIGALALIGLARKRMSTEPAA